MLATGLLLVGRTARGIVGSTDGRKARQRPARPDVQLQPVALARQQTLTSCISNHGTVVGAETRFGVEQLALLFLDHRLQPGAQAQVGTDASGNDQGLQTGLL